MAWVHAGSGVAAWQGQRPPSLPPRCWDGELTSAHTQQTRIASANRIVSAVFVTNRPGVQEVATSEGLAGGT